MARMASHPPLLSLWRQAASWRLQRVALLGALGLARAAWAQTPGEAADGAAPAVVAPPPPDPAPGVPATPAPSPVSVTTVSRLPPGMAAEVQGGLLRLLASGPAGGKPVVVAELLMTGPTFGTLYLDGFLYVARGASEVVVLDVRDPLHPAEAARFAPGGSVSSLWGGAGTLLLRRDDGLTLLFDVSDPWHPRYQAGPRPPTGAERPGVVPLPGEPISQAREPEQSRLAVSLRPFLFFANRQLAPTSGGALVDFSYQYAKLSGLWWGIEVAPVAISSYYDGSPTFNTRAFFGYAGRSFGIAGALGSGLTTLGSWFQLGPVLRFGRLDRVHSTLRLMWSLLLAYPYPVSGELTIEGAINRRFGLRGNFTGDSALNGFHATLGLQTYHGGDRLWKTTVLTPALGFMYMLTSGAGGSTTATHHPGVIFSFTVEPRW